MGYVYSIFCDSCYYRIDHVVVGDATHALAVCAHCRQIRNPEMPPFRYDAPHCAACGDVLSVERPEFCLRCNGPLTYDQRMHFTLIVQDRYPEPGAIVHAHLNRRGKWHVPTLWLQSGRLTISGVPDGAEEHVIEAEVKEASKDTEGRVSTIALEFLRSTSIKRPQGF